MIKQLTAELHLSDDQSALLEENLSTFDEAFTRDLGILMATTIDENLPADSPYRKTETDVLEIFVRINREGTALSRSDLIFSMLKLSWRESAEGLPEFVQSINEGNSFDLDTDFVVRCLFAVSGLGGKLDIDLLRRQVNTEYPASAGELRVVLRRYPRDGRFRGTPLQLPEQSAPRQLDNVSSDCSIPPRAAAM